MNHAGLPPADSLLNNRLSRYKVRQMMMPDSLGGGKMIKKRATVCQRVKGIAKLIPEKFHEGRSYETTSLPKQQQSLKCKVIIQDEQEAKEEVVRGSDGLVFWTDGSRKDDEWTRCAVVWKREKWEKRRVHLGRQKEAFDAEMYAMSEAVKITNEIA
jgi:hypothetical protein